jgi:hypothetical protein
MVERSDTHQLRFVEMMGFAGLNPSYELNCLCCLKLECRHCEERSDEAIHALFAARWIASLRSQ